MVNDLINVINQNFFLSKFSSEQFLNMGLYCESENYQFGFQDPATPTMEGIIDIHHHIFFFLTVVFISVSWMIFRILMVFNRDVILGDGSRSSKDVITDLSTLKFTHNTTIEIIWTLIPSFILFLIAVPSFLLLYSMDEVIDPAITIKAIGHQWYWSYEYSDYKVVFDDINFDSYMLPDDELELGQLRLLEVDNPIVLPINTHIRLIVTASDVLHCWAVPSLGIKIDAVPGRLNQVPIFLKRLGVFYGQCSEICGVNHGFMPIVVKSVTLDNYISWLIGQLVD